MLTNDILYYLHRYQVTSINSAIGIPKVMEILENLSDKVLIVESSKDVLYGMFIDPLFSIYDYIVLDYSINVYTDLLICILKKVLVQRPYLKFVLLNGPNISGFYSSIGVIDYFPGIESLFYLRTSSTILKLVNTIVYTVNHIIDNYNNGSILIFCPSSSVMFNLRSTLRSKNILVSNSKIETDDHYVILTTTKYFEVDYVVDCGYQKRLYYDGKFNYLNTQHISQQEANLRSEYAKLACFRLYTIDEYNLFEKYPTNLRQFTDLTQIIYLLLTLGCKNPLFFDFYEKPSLFYLNDAVSRLYLMEFIDHKGQLTHFGKLFKEIPLHPSYLKVLYTANELHCVPSVLKIISMCHVKDLFTTTDRKQLDKAQSLFYNIDGDLFSYLTIFDQFKDEKWCNRHKLNHHGIVQAKRLYSRCKSAIKATLSVSFDNTTTIDTTSIKKCFLSGYYKQIITLEQTTYRHIDGDLIHINPSSFMYNQLPKWCLYIDGLKTTKLFCQHLCLIDWEWLLEMKNVYEFTKNKKQVIKQEILEY